MCVPQSLNALQILNAVGQAASQKSSSKAQQAQLQNSANLSAKKAEEERRKGRYESNKQKVETSRLLSQTRNALATAGIDTEQGSATDIIDDTIKSQERDRKEGLSIAEQRAKAHEEQRQNTLDSLAYNKDKNRNNLFKTGSTLLTRNFSNFNKRGLLKY
jgi:hypothetical protein